MRDPTNSRQSAAEEAVVPSASADSKRWPRLLAVVMLLYSSTAFVFLFRTPTEHGGEGDPLIQLVWIPIYMAVAWSLLRLRGGSARGWPVDAWLLAFLAVAAASVLWSPAPALTARRTVALGGTALCGIFLASHFTARQVLGLFRTTVLIAAAGSVFLIVFLPDQARDPLIVEQNALRGAFIHKNLFGRMMALGLCTELLLALYAKGRAASHVVSMALLSLLLILSNSATSLLVLVAIAGVILFIRWVRALPDPQLAAVGVLFIGAAVVVVFLAFFSGKETVLHLVGRDATLTNRTHIWDAVLQGIRQRPVLGFGYGSFWRGNVGPSGLLYRMFGPTIAHAHNGFLDIWAQLGVVGFGIVVGLFLRAITQALREITSGDVLLGATAFSFLTFLVLFNIVESALLVQNGTYTVLLCYVVSAMATARRQQVERPAHPMGRMALAPGEEP